MSATAHRLIRVALLITAAAPLLAVGVTELLAQSEIINETSYCSENHSCPGGDASCITVGDTTCYKS